VSLVLRPAHEFPALAKAIGIVDSDVELPCSFDDGTFSFFTHIHTLICTRIKRAATGISGSSQELLRLFKECLELVVMRPMARVRDFDKAVVFYDLRAPVRFRVGIAHTRLKSQSNH
jgi:hypothetical protein